MVPYPLAHLPKVGPADGNVGSLERPQSSCAPRHYHPLQVGSVFCSQFATLTAMASWVSALNVGSGSLLGFRGGSMANTLVWEQPVHIVGP